ncbi:MAG: DUF1573 domain-containing protein [Planctomycetales bacterium]|nr:DUF1573 domain-containing protein [Planctomycetales bacterium]
MIRHSFASLTLIALVATCASAQEWATKMFSEREHDFGAVARGAETIHRFEFENKYLEDIHIAGVRASCGCTTPSVSKDTLKTWEKGAIVAKFNTDRFMGRKQATLTVTIDKPFYAEVQLNVTGYIRPDVVINPGMVNFGDVNQSSGASQKVQVSYAGRNDWTINDVRSVNEHFQVELGDAVRTGNKVTYDMLVHLKPNAPSGFFKDSLTIVTNDARNARLSLPISGKIASALTIAPAALSFGEVSMGDSAVKKVIVQSKEPFVVLQVDCGQNTGLTAPLQGLGVPQKVHVVPMTFEPLRQGDLQQQVVITTNVGSSNLLVTANVR